MSDSYSPEFQANLELRECARCGAKFVGRGWHAYCHACYRHSESGRETPRRDLDAELRLLRTELERVREELLQERQATLKVAEQITLLEQASEELRVERDTWRDRYYQLLATRPVKQPAIPPQILRRLLWLCHPDRHGDSEVATSVTAWLLAQRTKSRR